MTPSRKAREQVWAGKTWAGQASRRPKGPAARWHGYPCWPWGRKQQAERRAPPPRSGFRGLKPAGGPEGGSQNLYCLYGTKRGLAGSRTDLEASLPAQNLVGLSGAGIGPFVEGEPRFPAVLGPTRPGRQPSPPERPQEGTALGLRFSPLCLKLRSGFWDFTFLTFLEHGFFRFLCG